MAHAVQIPAVAFWRAMQNAECLNGPCMVGYKHHVFWLLPAAVSGLLLLAMHFDFPGQIDFDTSRVALPLLHRVSRGQVDLHLPLSEGLHPHKASNRKCHHGVARLWEQLLGWCSRDASEIRHHNKVLINPSFFFSGDSLVIAVRQRSLEIRHGSQ